ncbi:hypothetical protein LIER_26899 [Lithospermum erythrorhizon]|uniref:Uncharacterized protein n=1 Tax=Lithospermum erythrorhizon TaxID=34254 RepID=A0AAV3RA18_LITER
MGDGSAQRSPIANTVGKNQNFSFDFVERVGNIETPIRTSEDDMNMNTLRHKEDMNIEEDRPEEVKVNDDDLGGDVNPSVKDTSGESSYKTTKSHSSREPTVSYFLTKLKRGRIKRVLRKHGAPMKFVREKVPSPVKEDDDIVIVSSTASRRRTRSSAAALEKKKAVLGLGGKSNEPMEPSVTIDLEEMERKINEKERRRKGKRAADDKEEIPTDGVDFYGEEHEARWKFVCARNILSERYLSEITYNNQTYIDILQEGGLLAIMSDIGPHWPQLVREFICSLPEEITDPASPIFHKVVDHAKTGAKLKPIGFPSLICSLLIIQHRTVLRKEHGIGEDAKPLTISDKLMKGKHVIDMELNAAYQTEPVPEGEAVLLKVYEEELLRVEAEIQAKTVLASELKAKINAMRSRVPPTVNATADNPEPVATGNRTSTSHV